MENFLQKKKQFYFPILAKDFFCLTLFFFFFEIVDFDLLTFFFFQTRKTVKKDLTFSDMCKNARSFRKPLTFRKSSGHLLIQPIISEWHIYRTCLKISSFFFHLMLPQKKSRSCCCWMQKSLLFEARWFAKKLNFYFPQTGKETDKCFFFHTPKNYSFVEKFFCWFVLNENLVQFPGNIY